MTPLLRFRVQNPFLLEIRYKQTRLQVISLTINCTKQKKQCNIFLMLEIFHLIAPPLAFSWEFPGVKSLLREWEFRWLFIAKYCGPAFSHTKAAFGLLKSVYRETIVHGAKKSYFPQTQLINIKLKL